MISLRIGMWRGDHCPAMSSRRGIPPVNPSRAPSPPRSRRPLAATRLDNPLPLHILVRTNMRWIWSSIAENLPFLFGALLPPLAGLAAGTLLGPLHLWFIPIVAGAAAVVGALVAYPVSCHVDDRHGQPWAAMSFFVVLGAFAAGAWLTFAVRGVYK